MSTPSPQPIIVGTGLSGLLISHSLSKAQISHALVGEPPSGESFFYGETTSMVAPTVLSELPELRPFTYYKRFGSIHSAKYGMEVDFTNPALEPVKRLMGMLVGAEQRYALQIDRAAMDQALFAKAAADPFCSHYHANVSHLDYDPETDKVSHVTLADGTELTTSHVFDASGQLCTVAKQIGLARRTLDPPSHVVQAYCHQDADTPPRRAGWQDALTAIRVYRDPHGLDAVVVCIPLGQKVSIRVSAPLDEIDGSGRFSDEALLTLAETVLAQHGVRYKEDFPTLTQLKSAVNEKYVYARAHGANWLLTSMAYCNTLVTTEMNAETSLGAFYAGSSFLKQPAIVGALYQQYMDYFLAMHKSFHWLATHDDATLTTAGIRKHTYPYLWANACQFVHLLRLQHFDSPLRLGIDPLHRFFDSEMFSQLPVPVVSFWEYKSSLQYHRGDRPTTLTHPSKTGQRSAASVKMAAKETASTATRSSQVL